MAQQHTYDTKKKLETAVLVGVHAQSDHQYNFESTMEELEALADKSLKIKINLIINIMLAKVRLMKLKLL